MNSGRTPYLAIALGPLRALLKATVARGLLVLTVAALPTMVSAAAIISATTPGQYNAGLGTLLDANDSNGPFPCANIACGDATLTFSTAPNLSAAAGPLGNWLTTPSAPGGTWGASQAIPSSWAVNTETAIIYTIDALGGVTNASLSLGVDNGIFVWLDGAYVLGGRAGGGASLGEYQQSLGNLSPGTHYLQVLREDHGVATGYFVSLTGDFTQAATVPEPTSLALLAVGLIGAISVQRRASR